MWKKVPALGLGPFSLCRSEVMNPRWVSSLQKQKNKTKPKVATKCHESGQHMTPCLTKHIALQLVLNWQHTHTRSHAVWKVGKPRQLSHCWQSPVHMHQASSPRPLLWNTMVKAGLPRSQALQRWSCVTKKCVNWCIHACWGWNTVDGRHPANHLGCIKTYKNLVNNGKKTKTTYQLV